MGKILSGQLPRLTDYYLEKILAEVHLEDGVMRVVKIDPEYFIHRLLEEMRHGTMTDTELFNSLTKRLTSFVHAEDAEEAA